MMTMSITDRFSAQAPRILAALRFLAGVMFACYGAQKVFGIFGGMPPGVPPSIKWGAGLIEFVGGILIALGLFTRPVAFLASGLMAFAYFIGHAPHGFWPTVTHGDLAILYCWLFLYLSAQGPGAFALDNLWGRRGGATSPPL
jgi:putative oxidoreductase